ncbi:phage tail tape measure protein [uncultured Mediterranean phage uvMED]|nr:phage tail tape measure protein [uncultured Mediterranean phage uvMED]
MADYGVNIKVGVQGQSNARQLGEQIREIVSGLEAADNAFTRFTNNLKSFDQRRAQRKINEELDKTAQKYRELDRLQRQLLANDNSAIKSAERRAKLEEFISKNISAGRMRRRAQFLRGDPAQYPSGANQPFAPDPMVAIRKQRDAEAKFAREIFNMEQDFNRKINKTEIDLLQDKIKREMDAQQEIFNNAIRLNKKAADDFDRRLARATRDRSEATRLTGQTSPIGGAVGIPGSPAALAATARAQRIRSAQGSALIGGAFPLLFGQGFGAAAGGAAGGFGGGMMGGEFGFGLSLVGTQIGSMIDQLAQKAIDLGKALNPLTADTQVILEAVGRADTEFASLVKELEAAGESARALELATQELEMVVGTDGVEALELFSNRMSGLQNTFATFITFVSAKLAQAINDLTGETSFVQQARSRTEAVSRARGSKDPEIVAAVKALDKMEGFGVDPRDRIAQQEKIVELLNKGTESERERIRLNELAQKQGKDQARMVRASTAVTALQVQLLESGVHASSEQGAVIRRRVADLQEEEATTKAYKDFATDAISKDTLRARLADARVKRERAYAQILKDVNNRTAQLADQADRDAQRQQKAIDRRVKAVEREMKRTDTAFDRTSNHLEDITRKHKDKMAFEREYSRLIQEGSTPAAAKQAIELKKQLLELDRSYERHLKVLDAQIATTEAAIIEAKARDGITQALQDQIDKLDELKKKREGLPGEKDSAEGAIKEALKPKTGSDSITAEIDRIQGALNDLTDPAKQVIAAAQAIGDAFSESFKGLITGSMSAQQALANLFSRTADHFADMAAQMIAHAIKMKIMGIALNFLGGAAMQTGPAAGLTPDISQVDSSVVGSLGGIPTGMPTYAQGGYVSGPTRALVGEGGQGEYIIPENKMRESMARYSRGARGSSVVSETGASGTSGEGGGTAVAAPIDVRFSVERINSVDYVTADQFQRGMQQAAAQGATQGEQRALTTLRQNTSQRRRIGL